jgi:microcompartment protein CcmK/EutM
VFIGEVVGSVIATRKTDNMQGLSLRLVRPVTPNMQVIDGYNVAVDAIGANKGELVLVAIGSTARHTRLTDNRPCDAVIMAIIDTWQINGEVKYLKSVTQV